MNLIEKLEGMRKFAVEHYNPMAASGAITVIDELVRWTKTAGCNKHDVSGKQQIQWQAIESYVNRFSTSHEPFKQLLLKQAREWFEREFVACASGGVDKTVCDGCEDIQGFYLGTTCPKCNRPFRQVK